MFVACTWGSDRSPPGTHPIRMIPKAACPRGRNERRQLRSLPLSLFLSLDNVEEQLLDVPFKTVHSSATGLLPPLLADEGRTMALQPSLAARSGLGNQAQGLWRNGHAALLLGQHGSLLAGFACCEVGWVGCVSGYMLAELSLPGARTCSGRAFLHAHAAQLGVVLCRVGFLNVLGFITLHCLSRRCCCLSVLWHFTHVNLLWAYPLNQPFDKVWGLGLIWGCSCSVSRISSLISFFLFAGIGLQEHHCSPRGHTTESTFLTCLLKAFKSILQASRVSWASSWKKLQ